MLVNLVKYFIEIQVKLNVWLYRDFKGSFLFIFRVWSLFICLKIFSQQYLFQFLFLLWSNAHPTIIKYNLKLNVACGSSRTRNDNQAPNKHRRRWHAHHHILSKGFEECLQIVITPLFWLNDVTFDCMLLQYDITFTELVKEK